MQIIVQEHFLTYLRDQKILSGKHYGFLGARPNIFLVLLKVGNITQTLYHGRKVDIVCLVSGESFDGVPL